MKVIAKLILVILISLFTYSGDYCTNAAGNTENFYLESSSTNPVFGEEFWVNLAVKPTKDINIAVFRLKLNFDSSQLKYTELYSEHGTNDFKINLNQNSLTIIFLTGEKGINLKAGEEKILAEINFKVLSSAKEGISKISAQMDGIANYSEERILSAKDTLGTTINVEKAPDPDCNLKHLSAENYTLCPEFSEDITKYSLTVPSEKSTLEVTAEPNYPNAKVTVSRKTLNAAGKSTDINITVTSANKKSKKIYSISVNRLSKVKSAKDTGSNKSKNNTKNNNNEAKKSLYSGSNKSGNNSGNSSSNGGSINIERNHFNLVLFLAVSVACIFLGILILRSKADEN